MIFLFVSRRQIFPLFNTINRHWRYSSVPSQLCFADKYLFTVAFQVIPVNLSHRASYRPLPYVFLVEGNSFPFYLYPGYIAKKMPGKIIDPNDEVSYRKYIIFLDEGAVREK